MMDYTVDLDAFLAAKEKEKQKRKNPTSFEYIVAKTPEDGAPYANGNSCENVGQGSKKKGSLVYKNGKFIPV